MITPINSMWTEKYRPKKIDDVVGKSIRTKIIKYLEQPDSIPHMLFYSVAPGLGKTSLAKVIINELDTDALIMNSSDDRKIDSIREKVNQFVKTRSSKPGKRRIVFLDEVDGMGNIAQDALRNIMETYATNALFILTCNNVTKVIDPIQSRCGIKINFGTPDRTEIYDYLKKICDIENLSYTEQGLKRLIDINYPSIRNCVQVLQSLYTENKPVDENTAKSSDDIYQTLWSYIHDNKDWKPVKDYILTNDININELNKFFWLKSIESSNIKLMQITASNEFKFAEGSDPIIIFITSLIDMTK